MKDKTFKIRTNEEFLEKLDELVDHYRSFSVGTVTKTSIVEFAVSKLHEQMKQSRDKEAVK